MDTINTAHKQASDTGIANFHILKGVQLPVVIPCGVTLLSDARAPPEDHIYQWYALFRCLDVNPILARDMRLNGTDWLGPLT